MSQTYDCLACGACCYGKRNYVQVFGDDAERLGAERIAAFVAAPVGQIPASVGRPAEPERFMRMVDGHCSALGASGPNRNACSVYADRPVLCRALEPGTGPCLEARARMGLEDQK